MKKEAFKLLHDIEGSWWYEGRKQVAIKVLNKFLGKNRINNNILDFGAGFGGMYGALSKFGVVSAFEPDHEAKRSCEAYGYKHVFVNREEALSGKHGINLVVLFDVMEHVKDHEVLSKMLYESLPKDGRVLITVPAFQWLWGKHDVEHQHYRRYTKSTIKKLLEDKGFEIEYASYWNMFLFLPAAAVRLLGKSGENSLKSKTWINALFSAVVGFERIFMPKTSLPFGTGIVVLAKKNK